jgi:hypothetical protein
MKYGAADTDSKRPDPILKKEPGPGCHDNAQISRSSSHHNFAVTLNGESGRRRWATNISKNAEAGVNGPSGAG